MVKNEDFSLEHFIDELSAEPGIMKTARNFVTIYAGVELLWCSRSYDDRRMQARESCYGRPSPLLPDARPTCLLWCRFAS